MAASSATETTGCSSNSLVQQGNSNSSSTNNNTNNNSKTTPSSDSDCFTQPLPPSHLPVLRSSSLSSQSNHGLGSNNHRTTTTSESEGSPNPKPEKVKSRWRRNSELESGHGGGGGEYLYTGSTSSNGTTNSLSTNNITNDTKTSNSSSTSTLHSPLTQNNTANIPKETEPLPQYDHLDENLYLFERKKSKCKKEMRRMVCNCILTKEERQRGVLGCLDDCLNRMLMIECGSRCLLGDHCANKRFQKRQFAKVEPFKTQKKGWGLRALQPLQPGTFIVEYVGEVLDPKEFKNRVKRYSKENREHYYFMALKSDEIIDATLKGNCTRFINHSCDPNAETQKWTVNGELRIGFFAKRFIDVGEEITFDYQFQRYGKKAQRCYCDAPNCRGFIGSTKVTNINIDGSLITPKQRATTEKAGEEEKSLEDEFEDLGLEEEIAKLSASGGIRNRQQTLMLARLMVRAEDTFNRGKLLDVLKCTQEIAYLRLFLDYHGLQLLWSWMVDLEDIYLKGEILEVLAILPIPNKTVLKDSKVLDVVERWAKLAEINATQRKDILSSVTAQLPLIVEPSPSPSSSCSPSPSLLVSVKEGDKQPDQQPKKEQEDDQLGKDQEPQPKEESTTEAVIKIKQEENLETVEEQSETKKGSKVIEPSSQVEPNNEAPAPASESTKDIDMVAKEEKEKVKDDQEPLVDVQVEIELANDVGSEVEIKQDINGVDTDMTSGENQSITATGEEAIPVESEPANTRQTRSSSSSSTSSSGASSSSVTIPPVTAEKIVERRVSVKSKSESKDKENKVAKEVVKPVPDIAKLTSRLLYLWKDLKEVFRIPRLERQKRHEDEKEADRKAIEMEERKARGLPIVYDPKAKRGIDNRDNTIAGILRLRDLRKKTVKRSQDDKNTVQNSLSSTSPAPTSNSNATTGESAGPTPPKVNKEVHRMQFEVELMRKQYDNALKKYQEQMEQFNEQMKMAMANQQIHPPQPMHPQQLPQHQHLPLPPYPPPLPTLPAHQQSGLDLNHQPGSLIPPSPFKLGAPAYHSPATTASGATPGPPHPPPVPPPPISMYSEANMHQGYPMNSDYSSNSGLTPVAPLTPLTPSNDYHSSFHLESPHVNHVNTSTTTSQYPPPPFQRAYTSINEDPTRSKENRFDSPSNGTPTINQSTCSSSYTNPVLIECTNSLKHTLMADEKAVIQTDYGVEYVPIKKSNDTSKSQTPQQNNRLGYSDSTSSEFLFNSVYPSPGTYYLTLEHSCYFVPPPFDRHGHQIEPSVFDNVPRPFSPSSTKEPIQTALPPNWRCSRDKQGNVYYYNRLTQTVQWDIPEVNMLTVVDEKGALRFKESVVVSNADSTSTPRDETAPKDQKEQKEQRVENTPTPLPSAGTSPQGSLEEPLLAVNGESETPDNMTVNEEDSNECMGTPSHTLPGSYDPDPRKRKHLTNNNNINNSSNSLVIKSYSSLMEVNDGDLIASNRKDLKSERRIKEKFKAEMSEHIKYCLNPYRKLDCRIGRILCNEDFKYVARRLTHFVMLKELRHCRNIEDLSCSETVKHKAKEYVKKYMANKGPIYRPEAIDDICRDREKLSPKDIIQDNVNDHSVDIYTSDQ